MRMLTLELSNKDIPIADEYPIVPPDMNYIYFHNATSFPLQCDDINYSPVNAWWFSECSFLSYAHPGFARMAFQSAGFENFKHFGSDYINCMIVWNEQCIIVTFRGSELNKVSSFHNLISNLDSKPIDSNHGGKVHQGFLKALNKVWEKPIGVKVFLDNLLEDDPKRKLWFTGHSLGGALAGLAFSIHPSSFGLYTYGTPRFGNDDFIALSENKPVWRIVNFDDPVPLLPPDLPKINFNYRHLGKQIYLTCDGQIAIDEDAYDLTMQTKIAKKTLFSQFKRLCGISPKFKKLKRHSNIFSRFNVFKKNTQVAYSHISENASLSFSEWKDYFNNLRNLTSIKVENHMPIYYCCKLWNALIIPKKEES